MDVYNNYTGNPLKSEKNKYFFMGVLWVTSQTRSSVNVFSLRVVSTFIFMVNICKFWQILIDIFITVLLAKNWVPYPCFWMDLNQFSFAYSSYFYTKIESFLLGQTTWIGYVFKKYWPCIHFKMKFAQKISKHLPCSF